jgi:cytochrome c-type biogenesis protein CcmH
MSMTWRNSLRCLAIASLIAVSLPAVAVQPDEIMRDPAQEARARALSRELRCMVCQNQSIDDSDAPLARDLRLLVRERIAAGDSDGQVMDFLAARYGAFVLLKPRFEAQTLALWLLPPLALGLGALVLFLAARRRARTGQPSAENDTAPLSSEEQARLAELIGETDLSSAHQAAGRPRDKSITKV